MGLPGITLIDANSTFNSWYNTSNDMIARLNILEISDILVGSGLTLSAPTSAGIATLSLLTSGISFQNAIKLTVTGALPGGGTLGSVIGIGNDGGYTLPYQSSAELTSKTLGIVSAVVGSSSYDITLFGKIEGISLSAGSLYYLGMTAGSLDITAPTTVGYTVKPMLITAGTTNGMVLNQRGTVIAGAPSYSTSASRTVATIPVTGISAGNVIYYDILGATWAKSKANAYATSEVFGMVESITGSTATVVLTGSITLPAGVTHYIDATGGSGENDIWFLSGETAGHLQNLAPTTIGHIAKPVYYNYAHTTSGTNYTGTVVNYLGYKVESAAAEQFTTQASTAVPSEGDVGFITMSSKSLTLGGTAEYMLMDGTVVTTDASIVNGTSASSSANFSALTAALGTANTSWFAQITLPTAVTLVVNTTVHSGWNTIDNSIGTIKKVINSTNYIVEFSNFEKPTTSFDITTNNSRLTVTVGDIIAIRLPVFSTGGIKYYIRTEPIAVANLRITSNAIASIVSSQATQAADIASLKTWTKLS